MRLHRRTLHPEPGLGGAGDCHDSYGYGCSSPPSPPFAFDPTPAPAPSLSPFSSPPWFPPCPPVSAPSPTPVHGAAAGRRDQGGTHGYGPPAAAGDDHSRRFVTYVLIAAAAIAFISLILIGVSVAVRRRQVRRRRQALLAPAAAPNADDGGGNDPEEGGGGGGVVHHVWYIRTVGLDEAAIDSIAATRYRAGAGLLGAADCTVCLGEFQDGELVRLLPRCGHAFHVPCIDTWLHSHVNCPLCRSDVLDPAVTTASGGEASSHPSADPVANANAAAEQAAAAAGDAISDHEEEESDQEASIAEEEPHEQSSSPEPPPPPLPCPLPRNVRRAASMDAAIVSTAADVAALERLPEGAPEEEQSGRRKRASCAKASGSGLRSNLGIDRPASGGIPRSFFSRHCRARSSVLPL